MKGQWVDRLAYDRLAERCLFTYYHFIIENISFLTKAKIWICHIMSYKNRSLWCEYKIFSFHWTYLAFQFILMFDNYIYIFSILLEQLFLWYRLLKSTRLIMLPIVLFIVCIPLFYNGLVIHLTISIEYSVVEDLNLLLTSLYM